jgi:hypothetical protein
VHPDVQGRAYTSAGDGLGLVLAGGTAAGAWEARFCGKLMEVRLNMFERPGAVEKGGRGTVWGGRGLPGRPGRVFFLLPALAGTASPAAPRGGDKIRR